jgi:FkbM family methyltransferase
VIVDAGACFGDTALAFATLVGNSGEVHSFEPIPHQASLFEHNRLMNPTVANRIRLHPFALSDVACVHRRGGRCAHQRDGNT